MDTTKVNTKLPGAPPKAVYTVCGNVEQGLSVGWGDLYSAMPGQEIDFTGAPDGIYQLVIEVDPTNALIESNKNDNASNVQLASDTATLDLITATVTVPNKKQSRRDPIWDARVGGSVLRDAFTVTP